MDAKKRGIVREYAEEYYAFAAAREESRCYLPEHLDEVLKIVEEMGSIYIEVVELWAQGFTENESAAILNISPNTVKSRRNKIRKVVRERVGVSHP